MSRAGTQASAPTSKKLAFKRTAPTSASAGFADRNERRNITAGMKAMAHAILFPEDGGKGGRGKKTSQAVGGFGRELLRQARAVLLHTPELGPKVRDGLPLAVALGKHGGDRRSDQAKDQGHNVTLKHRGNATAYVLARLDRNRPDLAALIGLSVRAMNAVGSAAAVGPSNFESQSCF